MLTSIGMSDRTCSRDCRFSGVTRICLVVLCLGINNHYHSVARCVKKNLQSFLRAHKFQCMSQQQTLIDRMVECGLPAYCVKQMPPQSIEHFLAGKCVLLVVEHGHHCQDFGGPHRLVWMIESDVMPTELKKLLTAGRKTRKKKP